MSLRSGPVLIGVDLGTTVCKCLVVDAELRILGSARRNVPLFTRSATRIEQDAESFWESTSAVVRESVQSAGCEPRDVAGVCVSSQGIAFVPVDAKGVPLRPALSWLDTRAVAQTRRIRDTFGAERIFAITGKSCSEAYVLPKLLWIRDEEPQTYAKCRRFLMPLDFLTMRLTGECVTDFTMASGTMCFDVSSRKWSAPILGAFGLDEGKLPEVRQGGSEIGTLLPEAAEALGLPRSVRVFLGGQDQKVAALGAGLELDRGTVSLGTAVAVTQSCDQPVFDPLMRVPCFADIRPARWVLEGSSGCCSILDWLRQTVFPTSSYEELNRLAEQGSDQPGPLFFLPFFPDAAALFGGAGVRGGLHGLDLSTTAGAIVRSLYESVAYVIRANLDVMGELAPSVRELRAFGGGSRGKLWCQIIADVCRRPLDVLGTAESAGMGAAILAGAGSGVLPGIGAGVAHMEVRESYRPRERLAECYDVMYGEWRQLCGRLSRVEGGGEHGR